MKIYKLLILLNAITFQLICNAQDKNLINAFASQLISNAQDNNIGIMDIQDKYGKVWSFNITQSDRHFQCEDSEGELHYFVSASLEKVFLYYPNKKVLKSVDVDIKGFSNFLIRIGISSDGKYIGVWDYQNEILKIHNLKEKTVKTLNVSAKTVKFNPGVWLDNEKAYINGDKKIVAVDLKTYEIADLSRSKSVLKLVTDIHNNAAGEYHTWGYKKDNIVYSPFFLNDNVWGILTYTEGVLGATKGGLVAASDDVLNKFGLKGNPENKDNENLQQKLFSLNTTNIPPTHKELIQNIGHSNTVSCAVFSNDGKFLLTGSDDKTIKLWDVSSGHEMRTFTGHESTIRSVYFINNNKSIISKGGSDIKLWDIASGTLLKDISVDCNPFCNMDINKDSSFVACADIKGDIKVWDIKTGNIIQTLNNSGLVKYVFFTPNGKTIITATTRDMKHEISSWNINTGEKTSKIAVINYDLRSVSIDPSGKFLATGYFDGTIKFIDINSGKTIKTLKGHSATILDIKFTSDSESLISASFDKTLKIWDINSGSLLNTLEEHKTGVQCVAINPHDGSIISGGRYEPLYLQEGELIQWNENGKIIRRLNRKTSTIKCVSVNPQGNLIAFGSEDNSIKLWDINTLSLRVFKGHTETVNSIDFSPDGESMISGSWDKTIKIWNTSTGEIKNTLIGHKDGVLSVKYSPDGKKIISGGYDKEVKIWDGKLGSLLTTHSGHFKEINQVVFNHEGTLAASAGEDEKIIIWNVFTGQQSRKIDVGMPVETIYFSNDGKTITSGDRGPLLKKWDIRTGLRTEVIGKHENFVCKIIYTQDEETFVSAGSNGTIKIWDSKNYACKNTLTGHSGIISDISLNNASNTLISSSYDGLIKVWNSNTGDLIATLACFNEGTDYIVYTPEGYWAGSNNSGDYMKIVEGLQIWNIDQFAVRNNRPDIVMQALGSDNKTLVAHFKKQYEKRLKKLNLTESQIEQGYHTPEVKILKSEKQHNKVKIDFEVSDSKYNVLSYNIYANDVPLFGKGKSLNSNKKNITEWVELITGTNKIEVSCINEKGIESYRRIINVEFDGKTNPDLYFIGFGVSKYKDPRLNLQYAHKDVNDLEQVFLAMKGKGFNNVYSKVLTNEQVTVNNIKETKLLLENAKPSDVFILFIAGHGMHDINEDYYYLTYNTDLNNLKNTAANFNFIEDLLQNIQPRNKLFLLDACESGELDEDKTMTSLFAEANKRGLKTRGFKTVSTKTSSNPIKKVVVDKNRFIYNDLLRRSGAIVFSSSKGNEYSYEYADLENGLFTEFIMKAFTTKNADIDNNGLLSIDELKKYVMKEVSVYSGKAQNPTVDRDNIYQKISIKIY